MSNLFWLTKAQMARLQTFFPKSHDKARVDDRRALSGIIFINRNGLRGRDAPRDYGLSKKLDNLWKRGSEKGVFARMMIGLAAEAAAPTTVMIDATYFKAHRTATSLRSKMGGRRGQARSPDRPYGGSMNTQLHAVTDADGRSIRFDMTAGQVSDYTGAPALWNSLPKAEWLLTDRGSDAYCSSKCLERQMDKSLHSQPEVSQRAYQTRQAPIQAPQSHRDHVRAVEGLAARCNALRPQGLSSAVALAATVILWLGQEKESGP